VVRVGVRVGVRVWLGCTLTTPKNRSNHTSDSPGKIKFVVVGYCNLCFLKENYKRKSKHQGFCCCPVRLGDHSKTSDRRAWVDKRLVVFWFAVHNVRLFLLVGAKNFLCFNLVFLSEISNDATLKPQNKHCRTREHAQNTTTPKHKTQKHKNTNTQKHKNTKTQKHKNTKTQKHKNTKTQKHRNTEKGGRTIPFEPSGCSQSARDSRGRVLPFAHTYIIHHSAASSLRLC
jgi:hypothetical protein